MLEFSINKKIYNIFSKATSWLGSLFGDKKTTPINAKYKFCFNKKKQNEVKKKDFNDMCKKFIRLDFLNCIWGLFSN